jgi:hypothetical protein
LGLWERFKKESQFAGLPGCHEYNSGDDKERQGFFTIKINFKAQTLNHVSECIARSPVNDCKKFINFIFLV